jgi:hypothetical protein
MIPGGITSAGRRKNKGPREAGLCSKQSMSPGY